jgi:hypothetical protein
MPTIYAEDGFTVRIYTRDHRPPHVHVFYRDAEVIIAIGRAGQDPEVREVYDMHSRDVERAVEIVRENRDAFLHEWTEYHGG